MSDTSVGRRSRSPINAVKVINLLRQQKGLPNVITKPRGVRISKELKFEVTQQEVMRLFPELVTEPHAIIGDEQAKRLSREVDQRLARIKEGKEASPIPLPEPKPRKPRTKRT